MSDQRCDAYRELVSAFVDECLDGGELLRLEAHLLSCEGCRDFEVEVRRLRGFLRAAETFRSLRTPPPGFAARVAARTEWLPRGSTIPFPGGQGERRAAPAWFALLAAAAAAVLFFAWSWQRLLDGDSVAPRLAVHPAAPTVVAVAATADQGNMEAWLREHAVDARGGTLLGPAEEVEFASFTAGPASGR